MGDIASSTSAKQTTTNAQVGAQGGASGSNTTTYGATTGKGAFGSAASGNISGKLKNVGSVNIVSSDVNAIAANQAVSHDALTAMSNTSYNAIVGNASIAHDAITSNQQNTATLVNSTLAANSAALVDSLSASAQTFHDATMLEDDNLQANRAITHDALEAGQSAILSNNAITSTALADNSQLALQAVNYANQNTANALSGIVQLQSQYGLLSAGADPNNIDTANTSPLETTATKLNVVEALIWIVLGIGAVLGVKKLL